MKKLLLFIAIILLVTVAGCNDNQKITAWGLTAPGTDLTARVGLLTENAEIGGTEVFMTAKYAKSDEIEWGPEPDLIGGGIIFHLTQQATIEDLPDYSPLQGLFAMLRAMPYAGFELVGPISGEQREVQIDWILGTKFVLDPISDYAIVVEYLDGDQVAGDVHIGIMARY